MQSGNAYRKIPAFSACPVRARAETLGERVSIKIHVKCEHLFVECPLFAAWIYHAIGVVVAALGDEREAFVDLVTGHPVGLLVAIKAGASASDLSQWFANFRAMPWSSDSFYAPLTNRL